MDSKKSSRISDFMGKLVGSEVEVEKIVEWVETQGIAMMESLIRHKKEVEIRFDPETFDPHDQAATLIMGLVVPDDMTFVKLAMAMGPTLYSYCEDVTKSAVMMGYSLALDDAAEFMDDVTGTNRKLTSRVLDLEQECERLRSKIIEGDAVLGVAKKRIATLEGERG